MTQMPSSTTASTAGIDGRLQSTSLPFLVAATAIGLELGLIDAATSAALIGAGLVSVLLFRSVGSCCCGARRR